MAHAALLLVLRQDSGPGTKFASGVVMAGRAGGTVVLRGISRALDNGVTMGVLGKVLTAMTIRAAGLAADGVARGITQGANAQASVVKGIGMAVSAVIVMGISATDRLPGVTPATISRWSALRRGHHHGMILMLMSACKISGISGMAMGAIPPA